MGFISGTIDAFKGNPTYSTLDNVKSVPLQGAIDSALSTYNANVGSNASDLSNFISNYVGNTPAATANTGQETSAISDWYNGLNASKLAGLRASQGQAMDAAAKNAEALALRNQNLSRLNSDAGDNSYNSRLALGNDTQIGIQNALQQAALARGDWNTINQGQMANLGRRNSLLDALSQRALVPANARNAMAQSNLGILANIDALNNANNFYGLQQDKTLADSFSQFGNAADSGIMKAASIVGSLYGMGGMGGGGGGMGGLGGGGGSSGYQVPTFQELNTTTGNVQFQPYSPYDYGMSSGWSPLYGSGSADNFASDYGLGGNDFSGDYSLN